MTEQRQGQTPGSDGNEHTGQGEEVRPGKVDLGPGGLGGDAANAEDPEESIQNPQTESRGLNRDLDTLTDHYDMPRVSWAKWLPCPRVCSGMEGMQKAKLGLRLVPLVFSRNILLHTPLCLLLRRCFSKQCALILDLIKVRLSFYSILISW